MEGSCVNFLDQVQFFRFLKGRCHGNQFSGKNGAKLPPPALIALSIPSCIVCTIPLENELEYHYLYVHIIRLHLI